jgi:membrane complex biogenesis BtpA family protein
MRARRRAPVSDRPLVGVVHLAPSIGCRGCPGLTAAIARLTADLDVLTCAGVDAVLLENDNDKPHTLEVSKAQLAWLCRLAFEARRVVDRPLGINVQRIDWQAALFIAAAADLDFARLDVFVDRVRMLDQPVEVDPRAVLALRTHLGSDVALWTDVHVKHAELLVAGEQPSVEASSLAALRAGADVVLVTGTRTGEPPALDDVIAARRGAERHASDARVFVASGLTPELALRFAPHADGALVGTALKAGERLDASRTRAMVAAWRQACASLR